MFSTIGRKLPCRRPAGASQVAVIEERNAPAPDFQETLAYESRDFGQRRPPA
jgi:hypothetical protein